MPLSFRSGADYHAARRRQRDVCVSSYHEMAEGSRKAIVIAQLTVLEERRLTIRLKSRAVPVLPGLKGCILGGDAQKTVEILLSPHSAGSEVLCILHIRAASNHKRHHAPKSAIKRAHAHEWGLELTKQGPRSYYNRRKH